MTSATHGIIPPFGLRPGMRVGNYRLIGQVGRGYEAEVYAAVEVPSGARRAIKLYPQEDHSDLQKAAHRAWYYDQLSGTGSVAKYHHLTHWILDDGESILCLIFDLLDGLDLDKHLRQVRGRVPVREKESLRLIAAIAEKIGRVHRLGYGVGDFQHGGNIMVLRKSNEPMFVDLETGEPGCANVDLGNDSDELNELLDFLFPRVLRRDVYQQVKLLIEHYLQTDIRRDTMTRLSKKLVGLLEKL